jgi:hypothetical protein
MYTLSCVYKPSNTKDVILPHEENYGITLRCLKQTFSWQVLASCQDLCKQLWPSNTLPGLCYWLCALCFWRSLRSPLGSSWETSGAAYFAGGISALVEAQAAPYCHAYWTPLAGNALKWESNLTLLSFLDGRRAFLTRRLPAAAT